MRIISLKHLIIGASISLLSLLSSLSVQAQQKSQTIELKIHSESDRKQTCPDKIIVTEKARPYQEGGFTTDGSVKLSEYASNISVNASNIFSVTWVGKLKPKYAKCLASAGITKVDGKDYSGNTNYLRIHFFKGKLYFILDLAGGYDANDYPLIVLKKSLNNGNPVWSWGGTD